MKPFMYAMSVETFAPVLRSLSGVLDKGIAHAKAKKGLNLIEAKLAPDMFTLDKQVQIATDHAKSASAILAGEEPPKFEDNEKTLEELKARIARTVDYLGTLREARFEGSETRAVVNPLINGLVLEASGLEFLRDWSLPHFYFHVVTAYDILRHNGVEIGKRDYLSHIGPLIRQRKS